MSKNVKVPAPVAAGNEDTRSSHHHSPTRPRLYHRVLYFDVDGSRVTWCGKRFTRRYPGASNPAESEICPLCTIAENLTMEDWSA